MSTAENLHRREFAWQCLGGLSAVSLTSVSAAQDKPATPDEAKAEPEKQSPPAELLVLSALIQSYPSEHYTDEIYRDIYRDIAGDMARGKQLRAFPLTNGDGPACVFRAIRSVAEGTP